MSKIELKTITSLDELKSLPIGIELLYNIPLHECVIIGDFEGVDSIPSFRGPNDTYLVLKTHYKLVELLREAELKKIDLLTLYERVKDLRNKSKEELMGFNLQTFPETNIVQLYQIINDF